MVTFALSHLSDHALLRDLASLVSREGTTTAELLAHLAEVDERKLYLPAAYPSMYMYCVQELHMSEDTAFKRLRVARTARQVSRTTRTDGEDGAGRCPQDAAHAAKAPAQTRRVRFRDDCRDTR